MLFIIFVILLIFHQLSNSFKGPSLSWSYGSWIYIYLCNRCQSPITLWVRTLFMAQCTTLCDKICQWLATCRGFSPGPPGSSKNKTDRHDIAEIMLKVVLIRCKPGWPQHFPIDQFFLNLHHWIVMSKYVICQSFKKFHRAVFSNITM